MQGTVTGADARAAAWRKIAVFLILTAVLTVLATAFTTHVAMPPRLMFTIGMWVPGVSAILVKLGFERSLAGLGFGRSGGRWLLVAVLLPLFYALPVYLFAWGSGIGGFAPERWGAAVPYLSAPNSPALAMALLLTVGLLDKFSRALGEEIGWRGFLVPEFLKVTSFAKAGFITGAIWTCWHLPAILFEGYNSGGIPLGYQIACFAVMVTFSGVFFAWLRVESNSVWPPALLHAAHNLIIQSIFDQATVNGPSTLYVTGEFGIGLALTCAATALIVLARRKAADAAAGGAVKKFAAPHPKRCRRASKDQRAGARGGRPAFYRENFMSDAFAVFGGLTAIVLGSLFIALYFRNRNRQTVFETVKLISSRNEAIAPELIAALAQDRQPYADLRKGILFLCVAVAMVIFSLVLHEDDAIRPLIGIAAFPGLIGVAYIGFHLFASGNRDN